MTSADQLFLLLSDDGGDEDEEEGGAIFNLLLNVSFGSLSLIASSSF